MKRILLLVGFIAAFYACSSNSDGGSSSDTFDRTALLTNWADNIIIPAYENYQSKVQVLNTNAATFSVTPTEANLQTLRASWLEAYKAYQYISLYNTGKAEEISLKESANTYPTNAAGIEANVTSGSYNLSLFGQFDKQGFPALDYLINGLGANDALITGFYVTNAKATNYKKYLTDLTTVLKTNADAMVTDWNASFRDTFVNSNGKSVSSSTNKTVNVFVKTLERDIRSAKVGIPIGKMSNGTTFPEKVEGYYKGDASKALFVASITAAQDFFNGKHFGNATTGPGLKSYLDFLNSDRDGQKLSDIINAQYATILSIATPLNDNFSQQIFIDNAKMNTLYDALQQNQVYNKLDMMQALDITIDYVDGDGD